jgi:dienelactone hydrolase
MMLFGDRDHLRVPQEAFVKNAKAMGQLFDLKIYPGGGHSFMTQPAFEEKTAVDVAEFLEKIEMLPKP